MIPPTPWKHWNLPPRSLIPEILIREACSLQLVSAVSGMWLGAVTLITAVSTLQSLQRTVNIWEQSKVTTEQCNQLLKWQTKSSYDHVLQCQDTNDSCICNAGQMSSSRISDCDLDWSAEMRCYPSELQDIQLHPSSVWLGTATPPAVMGTCQTTANISTQIYLHNWI